MNTQTQEALKMAIEGLLELHYFVNEELETSYRINTNQAVKLKTKLDGVEKTIQACKEALVNEKKQYDFDAEFDAGVLANE